MALPTPAEFVQLTSLQGAKNKRGSTLLGIDAALEEWDRKKDASLDEQVQALYQLIKECGRYIHKHAKKKSYFLQGRKGEWLQQTRKVRVGDLLNGAQDEIKSLAPNIGRALDHVEKRKQIHLQEMKKKQRLFNTKSLSSGYSGERNQWVSSGKTNAPMSGSFVHMVQESPKKFLSDDFRVSPEGRKILTTDFTKLSLVQYESLGRHGGGGKVQFFNKIARLGFLAIPDGEGGFVDINDQPIHMTTYFKGKYADLHMFALDHHGNLLTRVPAPEDQQRADYYQTNTYFNHSSFNAGREVICAGMIWIFNGKLKHIDNNSGHYKPSWENLVEALEFLNEEGIDLSETRIRSVAPGQYKNQELRALSVLNGTMENYTPEQERNAGMAI